MRDFAGILVVAHVPWAVGLLWPEVLELDAKHE